MNKDIILVNPYNDDHIRMISIFESENIDKKISKQMHDIRNKISEKEFKLRNNSLNEIDYNFMILDNKKNVIDICTVHIEKDIKICTMTFHKEDHKSEKKTVNLITEYALNGLGMEEAFIRTNIDDKNMIKILTETGFESLGNDANEIIFYKEKEQVVKVGTNIR